VLTLLYIKYSQNFLNNFKLKEVGHANLLARLKFFVTLIKQTKYRFQVKRAYGIDCD
jgi:hypothetical protein